MPPILLAISSPTSPTCPTNRRQYTTTFAAPKVKPLNPSQSFPILPNTSQSPTVHKHANQQLLSHPPPCYYGVTSPASLHYAATSKPPKAVSPRWSDSGNSGTHPKGRAARYLNCRIFYGGQHGNFADYRGCSLCFARRTARECTTVLDRASIAARHKMRRENRKIKKPPTAVTIEGSK